MEAAQVQAQVQSMVAERTIGPGSWRRPELRSCSGDRLDSAKTFQIFVCVYGAVFSNLPVDIIHHQVVCPYPSFRLSRSNPFLICFHIPHICIRTTTLSHSPYPQRLARASQPNATTEYRNSQGAQSLAREHSSKFMFPRGITSLQALSIQALRLSRGCQDITVV